MDLSKLMDGDNKYSDPRTVDTWEIGFLKGKRTPTVERGETDFNTLGIWFRVYLDLGVREQDHRGMVKATGSSTCRTTSHGTIRRCRCTTEPHSSLRLPR